MGFGIPTLEMSWNLISLLKTPQNLVPDTGTSLALFALGTGSPSALTVMELEHDLLLKDKNIRSQRY